MKIDESQASLAVLKSFCSTYQLSSSFAATAKEHYLPFIKNLLLNRPSSPFVVGVSGAQGSGKSTLADLIACYTSNAGWKVAAFSLDDFYLTRKQREKLANEVHPLLLTRGVPGTHDTAMLAATMKELVSLGKGQRLDLPRFDKLADDRLPESEWRSVTGPVDLIIFEGWCLGARPQSDKALGPPINALEEDEDRDGRWRSWVNQQLKTHYQSLWEQIDYLAFIQAPDFASVLNWRQEQELRLARADASKSAMTRGQLERFIQHYQRITQHNLDFLPEVADLVFRLNRHHQITEAQYRHVSVSS